AGVASVSFFVRMTGVAARSLGRPEGAAGAAGVLPSADGASRGPAAWAGGGAPEGGRLRESEAATMTPITPASSPSLASLGIGIHLSHTRSHCSIHRKLAHGRLTRAASAENLHPPPGRAGELARFTDPVHLSRHAPPV